MTSKRQSELQRALDRAYAAGLDITGQGRMRNGNRFFLVPSATEPGRTHIVTSDTQHLHCDCEAGVHERICTHRALAHEYLVHEAAKRAAQAEEVQLALAESAAEDSLHTAAKTLSAHLDSLGPKPHSSTRAFSCFK